MKIIPFALLFLTLTAYAQPPEQLNTAPTPTPEASGETEKSDKALSSGEVFPTGPYDKKGDYRPPFTEEEKQAEEELLENKDETRVNKMGPNKR